MRVSFYNDEFVTVINHRGKIFERVLTTQYMLVFSLDDNPSKRTYDQLIDVFNHLYFYI